MSCPSSGGESRDKHGRPARVRPRFYPTGSSTSGRSAPESDERVLVEAEAGDLSEEQFAASLDAPRGTPRPRFLPGAPVRRSSPSPESGESLASAQVLNSDEPAPACDSDDYVAPPAAAAEDRQCATETSEAQGGSVVDAAELCAEVGSETDGSFPGLSDDRGSSESPVAGLQWRQEVAARLHHYHSRRTRKPPRYPSLALKFDPPAYSSPATYAEPPRAAASPLPSRSEAATAVAPAPEEVDEPRFAAVDVTTNIIEFPRPLVPPPPRHDELAEPILDLPRILDAPETVPKQVPLGGIILQPEETGASSDLELPLPVAPLGQRIVAAALDGMLVTGATVMFAVIANKIAALLPSARVFLGLGVALPAILWAVFQYVFLVYTGSTPGMRLTGLRLRDFDGSVPDRGTRRWRALAMALSAVSLGLGFLWCLLDEDTLCWHDRITRTYLDAGRTAESGTRQGPVFPQRVFACLRRAEAFLQRRAEETSDEARPPQP